MTEKPKEPYEPPNDPFEFLVQETQNDVGLTDEQKAQKIAGLREGQAEARLPAQGSQQRARMKGTEGAALLKAQTPDRDHPPELVAQVATSLFRGDDFHIDDYELAVARALRLLNTTDRIIERHKRERTGGEPEKLIPFGKALMQITGANSPRKAEERFKDHLRRRGHVYDTDQMIVTREGMDLLKIYRPNSRQIREALAPFRKEGFPPFLVDRLRKQYLEEAKRARTENLRKKKKKAAERK
jgi:hypothetical protein